MARFELDFYAKHLARRVEVSLVLPSLNLQGALANQDPRYYQNRAAAFPLIVCLCGFGDNRKTWAANTEIEALCEQNGFAACFVNGENKWYLNLGPIDDHYSFLEEDLLDFLYGNFANLSSEAPLFLAGVSMGGYGALYHYLRNTEKYQGVVALSRRPSPISWTRANSAPCAISSSRRKRRTSTSTSRSARRTSSSGRAANSMPS